MKTKIRRIFSILMLVILILTLVTLTAGAIAKSNLAKQYPAPGQLVDVGGYKMHINCTGQGSPTVILAAGMGDFSLTWAKVQPEIAKYTRVCSYDRAGLGWSEPSRGPRTANTMVKELHTLLVNANVEGPYVLVGHSMGGVLMRVYANNYPKEVNGMVLVDSAHEGQMNLLPESMLKAIEDMASQARIFELLSSTGLMAMAPQNIPNPGIPDDAYAQYQAIMATTENMAMGTVEMNTIEESYTEVRAAHITSFGNMPLIVLSRGYWDPISSISDADNKQAWEVWQALQSEMVGLSSDSKQVIAKHSGHNIQLDQPDLVIDAIRETIDAIQE